MDVTDLLDNQNEQPSARSLAEADGDTSSSASSSASVDQPLNAAVEEIQNELHHLAAIIQEASPTSKEKEPIAVEERPKKSPRAEEDDDTSKQATQDYDLHTNEKEVCCSFLSPSRSAPPFEREILIFYVWISNGLLGNPRKANHSFFLGSLDKRSNGSVL